MSAAGIFNFAGKTAASIASMGKTAGHLGGAAYGAMFASGAAKRAMASSGELFLGPSGRGGTLVRPPTRDSVGAMRGSAMKAFPSIQTRALSSVARAAPGAAVGAVGAGLGGFALYSQVSSDMNMHGNMRSRMKNSLDYGGSTRAQDFAYNPMQTFSRPRVRAGHMGASGGLTLAMNNTRTTR
jgi:hypothetical protein